MPKHKLKHTKKQSFPGKTFGTILATTRGQIILLCIILAAGFLLRMLYLYQFQYSVFFNPVLMDKYDQKTFFIWAQQIQTAPFSVDGQIFYMSPFYPYFLAFFLTVFRNSIVAVSAVQLVLDVGTCFLLFLLGKFIIDEKAGLIAAFFGAFYKTFIIYSGTLLSDGIILFLYVALIFCIYASFRKPNIVRWIISGIVLGFCALAKPVIAIYLPFLLIGLFIYPSDNLLPTKGLATPGLLKNNRINRKLQAVLCFALILSASALTILPITIRNYVIGKQFVPICSNGPVNWIIGNSSDSLGLFCYPKGELLNPLNIQFWKLFFKKVSIFFTSYEWPQNLCVNLMNEHFPVLKLAFVRFGLFVPFGVAGFFLMFRNWKKNFLFISFTFINILWVVLFFITDRYRLPAAACLMVSGSFAIVWLIEKIRENKIVPVAITLCFIGLFAYFFNITPGQKVPQAYYRLYSELAVRNIKLDLKNQNSMQAYRKAKDHVKFVPLNPNAHFLFACALFDLGHTQQAVNSLHTALQIDPGHELSKQFLHDLTQ